MKDRNRISPNQLPTSDDLAQRLSRGITCITFQGLRKLYIYNNMPCVKKNILKFDTFHKSIH